MATSDRIFFIMFLLCGLVMPCYFNHAAAARVVETSIGVNKSVMCVDYEREALLQFKQHITKDRCGLLTSWGHQEDCCQWRGIRCSNLTGHVTMLHLRGGDCSAGSCVFGCYHCLEGTVVSSLFELRHLKYLDLSCNHFNTTIPKSIDSLTNLKHLNLSYTGFYGEIPHQLGNISNLASLDLSSDYNTPLTTKSLHWLSSLTLLREIYLSGNDLTEATDWFETINKIHSLRVLYLDDCNLHPIIPSSSSYINSSATLRVVSLSDNNFNDTSIFQWLFNLSSIGCQFEYLDLSDNSLTYFSLSQNSLEGPNHDIFSNMRSLKVLLLSRNSFHCPVSKVIGNLCHLKEIDISHNHLTDDLAKVIETLSKGCSNKPLLESLNLGSNRIWGSISDRISTFALMRVIS